jgi:hypothetical protein
MYARCARTVAVALTFAAGLTIGACQDTTVDSNARQSATVLRLIPGDPPPATVAYTTYTIGATETGVRITWLTDAPVSTQWKWRVSGGSWQTFLGTFYPLKTRHYANIEYAFEVGVEYEFQALGFDIEGDSQSGAVQTFQKYAEGETYQFTTL